MMKRFYGMTSRGLYRSRNGIILGVCRGLHLIAVASGSQLIQDIPSQVAHSIQHFQKTTMDTNTHRIFLDPSSRLFGLIEKRELH